MRKRTKLLIYAVASLFLLALTFAFDYGGMMAIDFAGFQGLGAEALKVVFLIVGSAAALVLGLPLLLFWKTGRNRSSLSAADMH